MTQKLEILTAWKVAVSLAGEHLFRIETNSVRNATEVNQLRPDPEIIAASLGSMSSGQQIFVLSIYQFFSDSTVRDLCAEHNYSLPSLTDIAHLDNSRRAVLTRFVESYTGW